MKYYLLLSLVLALAACTSQSPKEVEKENPDQIPFQKWWKEGIIYQIYPRSFKDSNGDGIGDLQGIIQKLDYIKSLGVTMIWMNPFLQSPNVDNGYDVSNYREIDPQYGTMEDFDALLKGLMDRDIKFVLDVVVNHSSDQHEWFKQSRSSRDNPYRDYYHWWPAEKGKPPYRYSLFDEAGDAWMYDSLTDAYYLHYFAREQPDLNWENPKVRQEVYDIMKFWADKGVNGFRLDAFQYASKDTTFPDMGDDIANNVIEYYGMGPNLHPYLREMYDEVLSKYDVFAVSEGSGSTFDDAHSLVDRERRELQMVYHFEGMDVGISLDGYALSDFKETYTKWDSAFANDGWLSIFLANHDVPRMVSKYGNDSPEFRESSSKLLNTFIMSMRGTPYCYYGDELGMTNIDFPEIEQYQDISAINGYKKALNEGQDMELFMKTLNKFSRDNARTPMQWNDSDHAGFTTGTPWLPANPNFSDINVENQEKDGKSVLSHFKKLTSLRKSNPVLVYGDYSVLLRDHEEVYAYTRQLGDVKFLILLNFSDSSSGIELDELSSVQSIKINNYDSAPISDNGIELAPYQAIIFELK